MEFFLVAFLFPLAALAKHACPVGFSMYDSQCWDFHPEAMTWNDASQYCHKQGAVLVTIMDKNRQTWFNVNAGDVTYWTGLNSLSQAGEYVWDSIEGPAVPLKDSDYENWAAGQPENDFNKRCVTDKAKTGWTTRSCDDEKYSFTCQILEVCHDNRYFRFDGQCVRWGFGLTWKEASESCHKERAVLMPIFSKQRQEEADGSNGYEYRSSFWIGLNSISKLGEYVWDSTAEPATTLEQSGYENWGASQPEIDINKRCVSSNFGKWYLVSCDERNSYACVKPDVPNNVRAKKTESETRA